MSFLEFNTVGKHWEQATDLGNQFYTEDKFDLATPYYGRALFYSELMLRKADDAERLNVRIASPFFVSCLNLANNLWKLGKLKQAGKYFFYNVWHLKRLSTDTNLGVILRFEAKKNWEQAVGVLLDFYKKTNQTLSIDFWDEETYTNIAETRKFLVIKQSRLN